MKILIIGAAGQVGRALTALLLENGVGVRALSKSAERASSLSPEVETIVADVINDPTAAAFAFAGVDAAFMINHPSTAETVEGLMLVALARQNGLPKIVYQSVQNLQRLAYLPHLGSKLVIRAAIEQSGMDFTILSPNCFFQNDLLSGSLQRERRYLQPLGAIGCMSVDMQDIATAAYAVLTSEGHSGKDYNIVGPQVLTSAQCAANWAEALNCEISYCDDVAAWKKGMTHLPGWLSADLAMMYEDFQHNGMLGTEADLAELTGLLGRPPRSHRAFAEAFAQQLGHHANEPGTRPSAIPLGSGGNEISDFASPSFRG